MRTLSRARATVLALAFILSGLLGSAAASPADSGGVASSRAISASAYCVTGVERQFLTLINNYRMSKGRLPLAMSQTVGAAARHHSVDMASRNYTSHYTLGTGAGPDDRMKAHGYPYIGQTSWGENLYYGYGTGPGGIDNSSAQGAFNWWKSSTEHNANMLSTKYRTIGIGRAYNTNSKYKYYWTTDFAGRQDKAARLC